MSKFGTQTLPLPQDRAAEWAKQVAIVVGRNGLLVGNGGVVMAGQGAGQDQRQDVPALAPPRQPISETH